MIAAVVATVGGAVVVGGAAVIGVGVLLAKRVVNATARPKLLRVGFAGQEVALPQSDKTSAAGEYLLQLAGDVPNVVRVGPVVRVGGGKVHRALIDETADRHGHADGYWSAHGYSSPGDVGDFRSVDISLGDGETREAWLFPGDPAHWVIHVQGIRTSRSVTLRTVAIASQAGATSLTITYKGSGDGPPSKAVTLGMQEWAELRAAIVYARDSGAKRVSVVAWSMGAALVLELLKRDPSVVDDLVLMCPVSSWPATIEYGAIQAKLPRQAAWLAGLLMRSHVGAKLLGMPAAVDVRKLDWTFSGSLPVPTLVIHSQGDEVVPWSSTKQLVERNASTALLVETAAAPHGFELTVPDANAEAALREWLFS